MFVCDFFYKAQSLFNQFIHLSSISGLYCLVVHLKAILGTMSVLDPGWVTSLLQDTMYTFLRTYRQLECSLMSKRVSWGESV